MVRRYLALSVLAAALMTMMVAGCSKPQAQRVPPKTYSRITFELAVSPDENREFRERLIEFASRYMPGGWPIGIDAAEMHDSTYAIDVAPSCQHQHIIIADLVRIAAPPERIKEYLSLASKTAKCVGGLVAPARS